MPRRSAHHVLMYLPSAFAIDHVAAAAVVGRYPLAQLVVDGDDGLTATPVPMLLRGESLVGHLARPNPIWRHEGVALAIFTGADGYITPSWYADKAVDGKVVPTWNYETVQIRGRLVAHDDPPWKSDLVRLLTETFESVLASPWSVDDAPADWVATMLRGIVGIELVELEVVGKRKLSQNRSDEDQHRVREGLAITNPALAAAMGAAFDGTDEPVLA
jgi:transcriptional regulator